MLTPQFPARFWGAYFFADLCGGWIRARKSDGTVIDVASGISQPVDLATAADGSLYYLARGTGTTTGVVSRITYSRPAPRIDVTANGSDGPVTLPSNGTLQLDLAFTAGASGPLSAAEIYVGLITPFGTFWLDPVQGFIQTVSRVYIGPVGDFSSSPWLTLPPGSLPRGGYWWFIFVDDDTDGVPTGDFSDFVVTIFQ